MHKVLVSKALSWGDDFTHPEATIHLAGINATEQRLEEFDIVILRFSEFNAGEAAADMGIFRKEVWGALEKGTYVCFLHSDEPVPDFFDRNGYLENERLNKCLDEQAGFYWLLGMGLRIHREDREMLYVKAKRGEFADYLRKWGACFNWFHETPDGKFDDVICTDGDKVLGFSVKARKGWLVYLPLQANIRRGAKSSTLVKSLVDALITYIGKRRRELPEWAKEPLFAQECDLYVEREQMRERLQAKEAEIAVFEGAKGLLIASEGDLELAVPRFLREQLQIPTRRDEIYAEDFWLQDDSGKDIALCDVKSVTKGFKKGAIYEVYNHRESRGLPETFPGVLFVNANLQAASWKTKAQPIPVQDQKIAVENNVLIVRIEDLVMLWDGLRVGKFTREDCIRTFTEKQGWCEVAADYQIRIRDGSVGGKAGSGR